MIVRIVLPHLHTLWLFALVIIIIIMYLNISEECPKLRVINISGKGTILLRERKKEVLRVCDSSLKNITQLHIRSYRFMFKT